jgi:endonuclease/exonuclease/phosphatase family metal-dependent hydrolase
MPTLATWNANNLFLRYRFAHTYPGDVSKKSAVEAARVALGYLPGKDFGRYKSSDFVIWDKTRRELAVQALAEPDGELPDILCLQEVENLDALRVFNEDYLGGHYSRALLIDGWDPRNIDVGLLSVFPILDVRSHVDERDKTGKRILSRDCLEVTLRLNAREELTVLVNHLKSEFIGGRQLSAEEERRERLKTRNKRLDQARYVAELVERRFARRHHNALYAVVGDLNDAETSRYLRPLLRSSHLGDVVAPTRPRSDRWTYFWGRENRVMQLDYVLGSRSLGARVQRSHIERAGLPYDSLTSDGEVLPRRVTLGANGGKGRGPAAARRLLDFPRERYEPIFDDLGNHVSDHCPVKVWF